MINTVVLVFAVRVAPVTSLHFWVINTGGFTAEQSAVPVTSLHFWVINTLWCVITWE